MSKEKETDKLLEDVMAAEKSGYGCHYGNYIAARKEEQDRKEALIKRAGLDQSLSEKQEDK